MAPTEITFEKCSVLSESDMCMKICNVRCAPAKSFMADIVMFVGDSAEFTNSSTSRPSARMFQPVRVSSPLDNLAYKAVCTF